MAEKKKNQAPVERKIVSASTGVDKGAVPPKGEKSAKTTPVPAPAAAGGKSATGLRIGAVVFWLLGIACEVLAVLLLNGTLFLPGMPDRALTYLIIALVVDLIFVIIGSQLWKKSNDIDPASEKNKVKFFLWNNMGLIASIIAFMPIIVLFLTNKDMDAKAKRIASAVAVVALVIAGACSIDYNPASAEDLAAAENAASATGISSVYWTPFGRSYHVDPNCQSLQRSSTIYEGTLEEAFAANRNDPCDFCALEFAASISQVLQDDVVAAESVASAA